jgi:nucleoid-associated protein YgaU
VDLTFIKELDNSGFIDRLYKTTGVAKTAPRVEPAPTPAVAIEDSPVEAKVKPIAEDANPRPVVKQMTASTEKAVATTVTAKTTRPATQDYTVQLGDTLSKLAERFYNSQSKWEQIYEANKNTVKNPNYIYVGQRLMIPIDG